MVDRREFTPNHDDPPFAVPLDDLCTVPTQEMACLLAALLLGDPNSADALKDVLEIGTGSGYQTAFLAERCRSVLTVDVKMQPSAARLPGNVAIVIANGYEYDSGEEFDGVLVTFGASHVSMVWAKQVKDGGKIVVPLVSSNGVSRISVYERRGNRLELLEVAAYAPFTPGAEA